MSKVTMYAGETLIIQFADTDGEFTIDFDSRAYPMQLVVRESDGIKGNKVGDANAILYHEEFGLHGDPNDVEDDEFGDDPTATVEDIDEHYPDPVRVAQGVFLDANSVLRHTELVNCLVREKAGEKLVVTLAPDGTETGEFTYYPNVQTMEAVTGLKFARCTI